MKSSMNIILCALGMAVIVHGGECDTTKPTSDVVTEPSPSRLARLKEPEHWDARHLYYSERLAAAIERLDRLFGDNRLVEDNRRSSLLLGVGLRFAGDDDISLVSDVRLRMVMPRLKERLQIVLDDIVEVDAPDNEQSIIDAVRETRPDAALRYIFSENEKIRTSGDIGIRTGSPHQLFGRGRWRLILPIGCWETRLSETVYWLTDDGWRLTTDFNLTRPVGAWYFNSASRMTWEEIRSGLTFGQTFSLTYEISKRRAYRLYTSATWPETPHTREANYSVGAVYRQRIHRDWLYMELSSALEFPQMDDYEPNPFVGIKMEILFGGY
jgi:hypothetical protein